ncbi:Uma2 family endonuclease [Terriglobus roseus]|uniref:Endonuclease, Uma2 family (Restriction endonuclease fold) n=1 Tax=Terriglobus roseus TaxID=392734 RepID=A0A1H4SZL7_9BACT|nr:Uma2 family endonuclease [Terriglobus roseus]SEC49479.1 Endonuclease, Uma2 family (restriction endonuclease fold) [Terriglobus roseus]
MATTPTLMTMEQYLHTSFHPDVDLVDGEIQERNLGEKDHGRAQGYVYSWFLLREASFALEPILEYRMIVGEKRVRICDVALVQSDLPDEQVGETPPVICVEIMCPEDRLARAVMVLSDYRTMGVSNIWLIDPQERIAYVYGPGGLERQQDLILRAPGTDIALDVNDLFADLDKRKNKEKA